ncbi:MAG: ATP-binding protein [Legionellaceae bacterium]|nr:ATP-binding protein [Legionellaceae bacterium]
MVFLSRDIENEVMLMAETYPVITVLGPRQSGKTTLVRHLFPHKPYISLENPDDRSFAEQDPRGFLEKYPDGAIFDEVQRLPILLSYLQGIVDKDNRKGLFILTGSHQLELQQSISQSLAGRTAILKLLPLCLSELTSSQDDYDLDHFLYQGMYPKLYQEPQNPTKFYRNYLQTYVERDIRQMVNIKDLSTFQQFIKLCASRIGQLFNASDLSNALGISANTVTHWVSILEASFVVFRLQPYFENFGKRMIKSPKIYFNDVGLASYCLDIHTQNQLARDPLRGHLVENFVLSEFIKHRTNQGLDPNYYFYRDSNQNEVDILMKMGHQLIPIEIKSSKTFHPDFLKSLNHFQSVAKTQCGRGILIYAGDREQRIHEIDVINFRHIKSMYDHIVGSAT